MDTATDHQQIAYLNVLDPEFRPDSPLVEAARAANWYAETPIGPAVLRYEEVTALLKDRRLNQGARNWLAINGITTGVLAEWWASILPAQEGLDHLRLVRLISRAFAVRSVEQLAPAMRTMTHQLIDTFVNEGRCDFMAAFANLYPSQVIMDLLGISPNEYPMFRDWASDLGLAFGINVVSDRPRIEAAITGLYGCIESLVDQRRSHPGDDLLSALVAARDQGDRLSDQELRAIVTNLVFAGHDTTRHQLGFALLRFIEHPDQWSLLADRPELAATMVEEILRADPSVPVTTRIAGEDFRFNGLDIAAGTILVLFLISANTDASIFGDAAFDITTERAPNLTFGGGIHACTGSMLARVELREALPILARRLGTVHLAGSPTWRPPVGVVGPTTLPIVFTG